MEDFMSSMARIAVDIGGGWLSRYEAGTLGRGDVVRSEAIAGEAQRVSLNGDYLCDASVAVAGGRLFAKIEGLEPSVPPPSPPERGDELTELLPFAIRLGLVERPLRELAGLGRLSFIDLGRSLSATEDAELLVAGVPLASGKVVVVDENFGLRIERRLAEPFEEAELRTTGALLSSGYRAEPIKDYDFTRPDCFTKRGIVRARDIHLEFLRVLQARLPSAAGFVLSCVDQMTYGEWASALPGQGRKQLLLSTTPARARSVEAVALPAKPFLSSGPGASAPETAIAEGLLAYAGRCAMSFESRPIVASVGGAASALLEEDPDFAITASCIRNGWKRVAELRTGPATLVSDAPPGEEAAFEHEMILFVGFEAPDGGRLELVYPLRCLEPCFAALNA
jgi:hypothetical protein